ncbi:MAG: type 4a pilus biogenesis protein PilO [Candidatus Omnitrophica bacterium]|nr:type 4a pilus biogenesis protein PilO [Candidatus Omnitrophota bacterium]
MRADLLKDKMAAGFGGAVLILFLGAYFFLYRPLENELRQAKSAVQSAEARAAHAHQAVVAMGKERARHIAGSDEETSLAMDELTQEGKAKDIRFTAITPKPAETTPEPRYRTLPIELKIEARFEDLGRFLGALENLEKTLVTVNRFRVVPDEKNPGKIKSDVLVRMVALRTDHGK